VLSGNKGRVLRASNSMATWKRHRPDHRSAGAASTDAPSGPTSTCYTVPVELCIGFTQTTHDDRRRLWCEEGVGCRPLSAARKINVPLPMIRSCSTCVI
jgi:hypothetical protein